WDVATAREVGKFSHGNPVSSVAFSSDGGILAAGEMSPPQGFPMPQGSAQPLWIWDMPSGKKLVTLPCHEDADGKGGLSGVAFSPDRKRMASAGSDNQVRIWEVATGRLRLTLRGHRAPVTSVAFSPDGRSLASASRDTTVLVWGLAPAGFGK